MPPPSASPSSRPTIDPAPIPFAVNGMGRIGRCLVRAAHGHGGLRLVAVNDLAPAETLARLLRRDSVHGAFPGEVTADDDVLRLDGREVAVFRHAEPAAIPWRETGARVVVEATGRFTSRDAAARHLADATEPGPRRVLISAIAPDADWTVCPGVNDHGFDPDRHRVVSSASCTSHCLALLLHVLHDAFGVEHALMNEVHSYTANQNLVDGVHPDPRRGRAAAINIVPTYSAAPSAVERLIPDLAGRVAGQAVRVPTPNVALLDLVTRLERPATRTSIIGAFRRAAEGPLAGLLATSDEPLVSSDFVGDRHSAVVDLPLVHSAEDRLWRVAAWYDNEWGYVHRLAETLQHIGACP